MHDQNLYLVRPGRICINDRFVALLAVFLFFDFLKGSKHYVVHNVRWYIFWQKIIYLKRKENFFVAFTKGVYLHELNYIRGISFLFLHSFSFPFQSRSLFQRLPILFIIALAIFVHAMCVIMSCCIRLNWLDCFFALCTKIFKYGRCYYHPSATCLRLPIITVDSFF